MASSAKAAAPKGAAAKKASSPAAKSRATSNGPVRGANAGKGAGSNAAVDIQPRLNQQQNAPMPTQRYGTVSQRLPIGLDERTREESVTMLNQLLADTITLRDMYK
jgi:starvation-inducible DNA-binding protein